MPRMEESPEARFFKPPNIFKQKVGDGGIPPERLRKAQDFIESTRVDFKPFAVDYLKTVEKAVHDYEGNLLTSREAIDRMTVPIMQLKANGGMFRYRLVSEIADILLYFLEKIDRLNPDSLSVIRIHLSTLQSITSNALTGAGGREGRALTDELERACDRYIKKYGTE